MHIPGSFFLIYYLTWLLKKQTVKFNFKYTIFIKTKIFFKIFGTSLRLYPNWLGKTFKNCACLPYSVPKFAGRLNKIYFLKKYIKKKLKIRKKKKIEKFRRFKYNTFKSKIMNAISIRLPIYQTYQRLHSHSLFPTCYFKKGYRYRKKKKSKKKKGQKSFKTKFLYYFIKFVSTFFQYNFLFFSQLSLLSLEFFTLFDKQISVNNLIKNFEEKLNFQQLIFKNLILDYKRFSKFFLYYRRTYFKKSNFEIKLLFLLSNCFYFSFFLLKLIWFKSFFFSKEAFWVFCFLFFRVILKNFVNNFLNIYYEYFYVSFNFFLQYNSKFYNSNFHKVIYGIFDSNYENKKNKFLLYSLINEDQAVILFNFELFLFFSKFKKNNIFKFFYFFRKFNEKHTNIHFIFKFQNIFRSVKICYSGEAQSMFRNYFIVNTERLLKKAPKPATPFLYNIQFLTLSEKKNKKSLNDLANIKIFNKLKFKTFQFPEVSSYYNFLKLNLKKKKRLYFIKKNKKSFFLSLKQLLKQEKTLFKRLIETRQKFDRKYSKMCEKPKNKRFLTGKKIIVLNNEIKNLSDLKISFINKHKLKVNFLKKQVTKINNLDRLNFQKFNRLKILKKGLLGFNHNFLELKDNFLVSSKLQKKKKNRNKKINLLYNELILAKTLNKITDSFPKFKFKKKPLKIKKKLLSHIRNKTVRNLKKKYNRKHKKVMLGLRKSKDKIRLSFLRYKKNNRILSFNPMSKYMRNLFFYNQLKSSTEFNLNTLTNNVNSDQDLIHQAFVCSMFNKISSDLPIILNFSKVKSLDIYKFLEKKTKLKSELIKTEKYRIFRPTPSYTINNFFIPARDLKVQLKKKNKLNFNSSIFEAKNRISEKNIVCSLIKETYPNSIGYLKNLMKVRNFINRIKKYKKTNEISKITYQFFKHNTLNLLYSKIFGSSSINQNIQNLSKFINVSNKNVHEQFSFFNANKNKLNFLLTKKTLKKFDARLNYLATQDSKRKPYFLKKKKSQILF